MVQAGRQPADEFLHFHERTEEAALRGIFAHALRHQFAHIAADGRIRIKRGVENLADFIQLQQGFAQQRQLTGNEETVVRGGLGYFQQGFAHVELLQALILPCGHELADATAEFGLIKFLRRLADADHEAGSLVAVSLADRHQQLQQAFLHARRRVTDHAQIE